MTALAAGIRRIAGLLLAVVATAMLSACVISSSADLVTDDVAATPLPSNFTMYGYKDDGGSYSAPDAAPGTFSLSGKAYVGGAQGEDQLTARFVPLGQDTYIVAVTSKNPGALYGVARIRDGILDIRMVLGDKVKDALTVVKADAPQPIADDLVYEDGGITISRPETLQYAAGLILDGKLPLQPLIAWVTSDPNATPPARILPDGDWYKTSD